MAMDMLYIYTHPMTAHFGVHPSTIYHRHPSIYSSIHLHTHIHVLSMHTSSAVSSIHPSSCACTASSHLSCLLFAASWGFFQAGRTLSHTDFAIARAINLAPNAPSPSSRPPPPAYVHFGTNFVQIRGDLSELK
jgi:hypothetical protein